ncbi:MAG TPA: hypothetical protein V6C99_08540 [Oculatellaceae cyanobacterium]|jgi:hypothetical protein
MSANETASGKRFTWLTATLLLVYAGAWWFYTQSGLPKFSHEIFAWPLTLLLLAAFWQGGKWLTGSGLSIRRLFLFGALLAVVAAMIPPFHSTDLYGYINRGWQQAHYSLNPYVATVDHIPGWQHDPMITNHWVNNPSPYGFLYLLVAKALCLLGGGDKARTILVFKGFNLLLHLCTMGLILLGCQKLNRPDAQRKLALYLYAFNPLILMHGLANGHNDILMGLFVTISAYCAIVGAWIGILPALMAATLVKYGSLVIMPFAALLLVKQKRWKALIFGSVLALLVFTICGMPYLPDWQAFHLKEIGRNAQVSHGSLHSCVYSFSKAVLSAVWSAIASLAHWTHATAEAHLLSAKLFVRELLKNILIGAYLAFYAALAFRRLREPEYGVSHWMMDALSVLACLVCLVSLKFYPWYFGMFFPLALYLEPGNRLRQLIVLVSGAQLFSLTFIGQAHMLNFMVMTGGPILWFLCKAKKSGQALLSASSTERAA